MPVVMLTPSKARLTGYGVRQERCFQSDSQRGACMIGKENAVVGIGGRWNYVAAICLLVVSIALSKAVSNICILGNK